MDDNDATAASRPAPVETKKNLPIQLGFPDGKRLFSMLNARPTRRGTSSRQRILVISFAGTMMSVTAGEDALAVLGVSMVSFGFSVN